MPLIANYRKTRGILQMGTRANQPSAADVLQGTLYAVTDEGVVERSTGSAWQTFALNYHTNGHVVIGSASPVWRFLIKQAVNNSVGGFGLQNLDDDSTLTFHYDGTLFRVVPTYSTTGAYKAISFAGGGAPASQFYLGTSGNTGVGTLSPPSGGGPVLAFGQGADPTGIGSNTAGIYAKDVAGTAEMFTFDEAGNVTQISPHNFSMFDPPVDHPFPWSYYSRNEYLGIELGVDLARLVTAVEALTGQTFAHVRSIPKRDWVEDQREKVEREIHAYETWETAREAFVPSEHAPRFEALEPPLPTAKEPPLWLRERLGDEHIRVPMAEVHARVASWRNAKPGRESLSPSLGGPEGPVRVSEPLV